VSYLNLRSRKSFKISVLATSMKAEIGVIKEIRDLKMFGGAYQLQPEY